MFLKAARASDQYQGLLTRLQHDYSNTFVLEAAKGRAGEVTVGHNQQVVMVTFPISGGAGYSGFTMIFNKKTMHIQDDVSSLSVFDHDNNIVSRIARHGRTVLETTITSSGQIVRVRHNEHGLDRVTESIVSTDTLTMLQATGDCYCCFSGCLASQGVPAWAVTVISIFCIAACAPTIGTTCLICAGAAAAIASGTLNYCARQCTYNGCAC